MNLNFFQNKSTFYNDYKNYKTIIPNFQKKSLQIPKTIHLTHYDKNCIPKKVWENLNKFAPDYLIKYYSDKECITFLKQNYSNEIVSIFKNLSTGPHKADLFRYCLLYKVGGIYLDIKIVPIIQLNTIFNHIKNNLLYTVLSRSHIFQGIIASYPSNEIFVDLITDFFNLGHKYFSINMHAGYLEYHYFTKRFYIHLQNRMKLNVGENFYSDQSVILFQEKEKQINNEKKDRYGYWNIFNNSNQRIFKSRYNDYPW